MYHAWAMPRDEIFNDYITIWEINPHKVSVPYHVEQLRWIWFVTEVVLSVDQRYLKYCWQITRTVRLRNRWGGLKKRLVVWLTLDGMLCVVCFGGGQWATERIVTTGSQHRLNIQAPRNSLFTVEKRQELTTRRKNCYRGIIWNTWPFRRDFGRQRIFSIVRSYF